MTRMCSSLFNSSATRESRSVSGVTCRIQQGAQVCDVGSRGTFGGQTR